MSILFCQKCGLGWIPRGGEACPACELRQALETSRAETREAREEAARRQESEAWFAELATKNAAERDTSRRRAETAEGLLREYSEEREPWSLIEWESSVRAFLAGRGGSPAGTESAPSVACVVEGCQRPALSGSDMCRLDTEMTALRARRNEQIQPSGRGGSPTERGPESSTGARSLEEAMGETCPTCKGKRTVFGLKYKTPSRIGPTREPCPDCEGTGRTFAALEAENRALRTENERLRGLLPAATLEEFARRVADLDVDTPPPAPGVPPEKEPSR